MYRIPTIGYDFAKDRPMIGCRRTWTVYVIKIFAMVQIMITGLFPSYQTIDFDYSEYLGPNYKTMKEKEHVSTIVCNH
jgi:hypothetical protein